MCKKFFRVIWRKSTRNTLRHNMSFGDSGHIKIKNYHINSGHILNALGILLQYILLHFIMNNKALMLVPTMPCVDTEEVNSPEKSAVWVRTHKKSCTQEIIFFWCELSFVQTTCSGLPKVSSCHTSFISSWFLFSFLNIIIPCKTRSKLWTCTPKVLTPRTAVK